jgi:hypothetical protein
MTKNLKITITRSNPCTGRGPAWDTNDPNPRRTVIKSSSAEFRGEMKSSMLETLLSSSRMEMKDLILVSLAFSSFF